MVSILEAVVAYSEWCGLPLGLEPRLVGHVYSFVGYVKRMYELAETEDECR